MTEKFNNLEIEKQQKILSTAYREFGEYGYEQASTNRIVKKASIGKGMLFYYFESKRKLYDYLVEYGLNYINENMLKNCNKEETDFIEKCRNLSIVKMKGYQEKPEVFYFFTSQYLYKDMMMMTEEQWIKLKIIEKERYEWIYENNDITLFRKDISPDKVIEMIKWTFEGYEQEIIKKLKVNELTDALMSEYMEEFYEFLERLKKVYYN